jgi:hypothetical protein
MRISIDGFLNAKGLNRAPLSGKKFLCPLKPDGYPEKQENESGRAI